MTVSKLRETMIPQVVQINKNGNMIIMLDKYKTYIAMILNPFESCSLQFLDKIADTGRNLWKLYSGLKSKILHLNDFKTKVF